MVQTAVVLEGLRYITLCFIISYQNHGKGGKLPLLTFCSISTSVAGRLPRVNTREAMTYKSFGIPKGTPVSTTQRLIHFNPSIFPSPHSFLPERWLIQPAERKNLEKYLQPFGRGSRSCLGIQFVFPALFSTPTLGLINSFYLTLSSSIYSILMV